MQKSEIDTILSQTKNQFLILVKDDRFFLNINKKIVKNDLGIIAINEKTGSASIIFYTDIDAIISDGILFK